MSNTKVTHYKANRYSEEFKRIYKLFIKPLMKQVVVNDHDLSPLRTKLGVVFGSAYGRDIFAVQALEPITLTGRPYPASTVHAVLNIAQGEVFFMRRDPRAPPTFEVEVQDQNHFTSKEEFDSTLQKVRVIA
jgi:hypothetical protein